MLRRAATNGSRRRKEAEKSIARNGHSAALPRPRAAGRSPNLLPASLQPSIRVVMMPRDANYLGTIFGGVILSSLDLAGAVEAHRHSDRKMVTAAMREVKFIAPVLVGDLVSFYTELVRLGRTSVTVRVTVEAKRAAAPHETVRVTQAEVVYVAIDDAGKPASIRI